MRHRGACLVAATLLMLTACGESDTDSTKASPSAGGIEPGSRKAAQKLLDTAEASFDKAGTGAFLLRMNLVGGLSISGVWDLRAPATEFTMTMDEADDGEGVVVRTRIINNTAYTQVSSLDDAQCWMKLDPADRTAMGADAEISPVHPAALMLLEPHAVGLVKDSDVAGHQDVRAEMPFAEAVSAVLPKAFNKLSEPPPDDATIPVTVGINAGEYASIRYSLADIISAAKDNKVDLFAGEEEIVDAMADATVEIKYRSFGDEVDIAVPDPDLIVDLDMAALQDSGEPAESCPAAQ
jgi:hypothetical protein